MDTESLKIPKDRLISSLWVETEGQVIASFFLAPQSERHAGPETPKDLLNDPEPFVVVLHEDPQEPRFYNKNAIVRVHYREPQVEDPGVERTVLHARLGLRDGTLVEGEVRELLQPQHRRLYDYLNLSGDRFIRIYEEGTEDQVILVNRDHIIRILPVKGS
ncbi:MAG: hypothetical protein D6717_13035 [Gammaproteobacteria bacterium]|nr:MAG: hypothetical protein D6717_13035 [Gammaproteobacteria bacterium]